MERIRVEREIWINAPRERVWRAVTEAQQIMKWWGKDTWEIEALEVGATVKFGWAENMMLARVAVVDPPREFSILWPPQEQYHSVELYTTFVLEEENGGTRVRVSESGYEAMADEIRKELLDGTGRGYTTVLAGLKAYVEQMGA